MAERFAPGQPDMGVAQVGAKKVVEDVDRVEPEQHLECRAAIEYEHEQTDDIIHGIQL